MSLDTLHIYTRVSSRGQKVEGHSLETQREFGEKLSQQRGWKCKLWNEEDKSSKSEFIEDRPVISKLEDEVKKGKVKKIFVIDQERISRNDIVSMYFKKTLRENKCNLFTSKGEYDFTNPNDELMYNILSSVGQYENKLRRDKSRYGKIRRVKEGYWWGSTPPFGYRLIEKKIEIDSYESEIVQKMFKMFDEGIQTINIKGYLDVNGVKPRRSPKYGWNPGSITNMLQNTFYKGFKTWTDKISGETVYFKTPQIISNSLWNSVNKRMKKIVERKSQNGNTKKFYLLRDILVCECGNIMSGRKIMKNGKVSENRYYCNKRVNKIFKRNQMKDKWKRGKGCNNIKSINIQKLDDLVWERVLELISKSWIVKEDFRWKVLDKVIENRKNKLSKDKEYQRKIDKWSKDLERVEENIVVLETGILMKEEVGMKKKILKNMKDIKSNTLNKLETFRDEKEELMKENKWIDWLEKFNQDIFKKKVISESEKRTFLESYIEKIVIGYNQKEDTHSISVEFKLPIINDKRIFNEQGNIKKGWKIEDGENIVKFNSNGLFGRYKSDESKKKVG